MNEQPAQSSLVKRRDFLKTSSTATLMTMLGGVRVIAQESESAVDEDSGPKVKVAVLGLGRRGREVVDTITRMKKAELAAICDTYPDAVRRCAKLSPGAAQVADYREVLKNPGILGVVVATPTHMHKEVVLAALSAGKHVYCEAPIAHTIEDARAIARAAKAAPQLVFQPGLHLRCDPNRRELIRTFRTGALGAPVMARAQWHNKQSWRATSPKPEREAALNWRLNQTESLGLAGEILSHPVDQARWFLNQLPVAVHGLSFTALWKDGRDVPDTVQVVVEFPAGVSMFCDATLANSFDGDYEIYYGCDSAVLLRGSDIWLFKEPDAPLFGWEVYFPKETFYKETGIVLKVGASKSVPLTEAEKEKERIQRAPLYCALSTFVRNASDLDAARKEFMDQIGDDPEALKEHLTTKVPRRPAPGFLDGFQAAVTAIKANQAILSRERIVFKPADYTLA